MTCPFTSDDLCAWVHGEEERADVAAQIESHVSGCPSCRSSVEEMRGVVASLRTLALNPAPPPALPVAIGRYRILGRLGAGGMGVVYEAEQAEPRRRVALKVVRGWHSASELQRRLFEREAQTLARLNHPNIAAVYDAGRTDTGEPYFAMEFVEGVDLLNFVRRPRVLPLRERLSLMLTIARAMSHAHERGVVHRDLKPGNVLVIQPSPERRNDEATTDHGAGEIPSEPGRTSGAPVATRFRRPSPRIPTDASSLHRLGAVPKILDFGLARAVEAGADEAPATQSGAILGTLAYMSPEQARGARETVDLRSDVYSLGVILYELSADALPIDVSGDPLTRAVRRIENDSPSPPQSLNPRIPRDVATLIMKCLEKSPERRYESAGALADDLERYLTGHPIVARPASRLYRAQRFLARHALPSALVSLLFATMLIAAVMALMQARRIAIERDRAREEATKVARLNGVLENLWQSVDPWKAGDRDVRVLDALRDIGRRVSSELADTPLLAASVRNTLGNTWRSLGSAADYAESEQHLRFAWTTREQRLSSGHLDTARSANDLAETLYWEGRYAEAEPFLRSAIDTRKRLLPADHPDLAESVNNLGSVLKQLDRFEEAAECYRVAQQLRAKRYQAALSEPLGSQRDRAVAAEDLAETHNNRGALQRALAGRFRAAGRTAEAEAGLQAARQEYQSALALRRQWLGDAHPSTATSHNNLGRALQDAGLLVEAEDQFRESLRILRAGVGERHQLVARSLYNLARLKRDMSNMNESRDLARQAYEMRLDLLGESHRETQESAELLQALTALPFAP